MTQSNTIKLKKEGFRDYSFEFKGEQYSVQYAVFDYDVCTPTYHKGWQVYIKDEHYPINERLNRTRQGALNTFLFNNA